MIKAKIAGFIGKAAGNELAGKIEILVPENEKFGHFSTNVALKLAKEKNQNPMETAKNLAEKISGLEPDFFEKIETASPGFVNFYVSKKVLSAEISSILKSKEKYGRGENKNETVIVEYSSPNIAKPLGIHHLSSTIIGQALVDILRFDGYKVISLSFPGDWGTQFGLLISGYKKWGNKEKVKKNPINELLSLYVKFSAAAKENPELLDEGRNEFKKLENGDKENLNLWKWFSEESMRDFERVYKILGMKIENTIPESYYESELKKLVQDALKNKIAETGNDGSIVIKIPESETPEIIQKSDGATIYATRELAAIRHRFKKWKADKILYVAANQQTFHLNQVFRCAELLGFAKPGQLEHVKFGMMLASEGKKFATREGKLIKLEDVLDEATKRSEKTIEKINPKVSIKEKKEIAKIIGIGAVKFFDLSQSRGSDIIFDWDKILNLKGASAPYIQYAYTRMKSVLKKSGCRFFRPKPDFSKLENDAEKSLVRQLIYFPDAVKRTSEFYQTNILTEYLLKLSETINKFYENSPILKAEKETKNARLALAEAASIVLKTGLNLLGIKTLERM